MTVWILVAINNRLKSVVMETEMADDILGSRPYLTPEGRRDYSYFKNVTLDITMNSGLSTFTSTYRGASLHKDFFTLMKHALIQ